MTFRRWLMGSRRNILSIKITHTHKEEKKSCWCCVFFFFSPTLFTIVQEVNQLAVSKRWHLFLPSEASCLTGFPPNARSWTPAPAAQMHLAPGKQHSSELSLSSPLRHANGSPCTQLLPFCSERAERSWRVAGTGPWVITYSTRFLYDLRPSLAPFVPWDEERMH